ncbi:unnamed protein product, partial [Anisakis simplex]|uniref:Protein EMBRYONIC FLOWER 1-like n=1 Tax=Anisakis simplex TaxID=6269 RepID=A0A0M3JDM0_ANISI
MDSGSVIVAENGQIPSSSDLMKQKQDVVTCVPLKTQPKRSFTDPVKFHYLHQYADYLSKWKSRHDADSRSLHHEYGMDDSLADYGDGNREVGFAQELMTKSCKLEPMDRRKRESLHIGKGDSTVVAQGTSSGHYLENAARIPALILNSCNDASAVEAEKRISQVATESTMENLETPISESLYAKIIPKSRRYPLLEVENDHNDNDNNTDMSNDFEKLHNDSSNGNVNERDNLNTGDVMILSQPPSADAGCYSFTTDEFHEAGLSNPSRNLEELFKESAVIMDGEHDEKTLKDSGICTTPISSRYRPNPDYP